MKVKLGAAACRMLVNVQMSEGKGLLHTTGAGGPLKWWKEVCKARKELEAAKLAVFIGPWEGGYIVTPRTARKYSRKLIAAHAELYTLWANYNGGEEGVTRKDVAAQLKKVRAMEKARGVQVIGDWDVYLPDYDPTNKTQRAEAVRENHRPTFMSKYL